MTVLLIGAEKESLITGFVFTFLKSRLPGTPSIPAPVKLKAPAGVTVSGLFLHAAKIESTNKNVNPLVEKKFKAKSLKYKRRAAQWLPLSKKLMNYLPADSNWNKAETSEADKADL